LFSTKVLPPGGVVAEGRRQRATKSGDPVIARDRETKNFTTDLH
jgi:hypothetical protein